MSFYTRRWQVTVTFFYFVKLFLTQTLAEFRNKGVFFRHNSLPFCIGFAFSVP